MIGLTVYLNGKKLTTSGADDLSVLNAIVNAVGELEKSTAPFGKRRRQTVGGLTHRRAKRTLGGITHARKLAWACNDCQKCRFQTRLCPPHGLSGRSNRIE